MTLIVRVGHAKSHLSDLLARVEAGEEVIIARGDNPIAKLNRIPRSNDHRALVDEIKAARLQRPTTTVAEILDWREDGRRC